MDMSERYIDLAVNFTNTYKKYTGSHPGIREMMCLKEIYPYCFKKLDPDEIYAGGFDFLKDTQYSCMEAAVTFGPVKRGQIGYFADIDSLKRFRTEFPHRKQELDELISFWMEESTFVKIRNAAPPHLYKYLFPFGESYDSNGYLRGAAYDKNGNRLNRTPIKGKGFISGSYDTRVAGLMPDFRRILRRGIVGLYEDADTFEAKNGNKDYYDAVRIALKIATDTLEYYRVQAEELLKTAAPEHTENLKEHCRILKKLQTEAPSTLREAIQLMIIFIIMVGIYNFGRLDVSLGDFLADDLDAGRIDEEEAIRLLTGFWDYVQNYCNEYDSRIIIGGLGRENEEKADRFALLAIETTRRTHRIKPVLTLRFYKGQNPLLFEKAIDSIAEGCIYPTLYNDDANVPGAMKSMYLPYEDAVDYVPLGCGEFCVAGKSISSPNSTFRMLKALEAVLHNGRCGASGEMVGIETGELSEFDTFDKLLEALYKQFDARLDLDAQIHRHNREITSQEASFIVPSLFMNDCFERGMGLFQGGLRYFGANLEGFALTNTINSLAVIKKLVYEDKKYTLQQIVDILDADFEGYEAENKLFKSLPKFGNDDDYVDSLKIPIENFLNERANYWGRKEGFHYCTLASVNPGGIIVAPNTAASADGRRCGETMALGNSAAPGTDKSGITSLLKSAAKADPANGGYVTNVHVSREAFLNHKEKTVQLLKTYFDIGGLQLNINCFNKGDLQKAIEHPELYPNLIVRVSGYSARFIDLDKITQEHIMNRTVY